MFSRQLSANHLFLPISTGQLSGTAGPRSHSFRYGGVRGMTSFVGVFGNKFESAAYLLEFFSSSTFSHPILLLHLHWPASAVSIIGRYFLLCLSPAFFSNGVSVAQTGGIKNSAIGGCGSGLVFSVAQTGGIKISAIGGCGSGLVFGCNTNC